jgi:hypothetical protein
MSDAFIEKPKTLKIILKESYKNKRELLPIRPFGKTYNIDSN